MTNTNEIDEKNISQKMKELNERMLTFSSILEKFGLDIITKLGQTNLKINMLTDKVTELHKVTLDIKSLIPQLNNVIESQKMLERELDLVKSLIINLQVNGHKTEILKNEIDRDKTASNKKELIITKLTDLNGDLETLEDPQIVITSLEQIKEDIFEFTGGHRILYEISQIINRLSSSKGLSELYDKNKSSSKPLKEYLQEKIIFWINKLMFKDKKVI
ncbi:MAG: hypothetical protein ACFFFB_17050 [Candidatus Heimdallarchaeota archaeon]